MAYAHNNLAYSNSVGADMNGFADLSAFGNLSSRSDTSGPDSSRLADNRFKGQHVFNLSNNYAILNRKIGSAGPNPTAKNLIPTRTSSKRLCFLISMSTVSLILITGSIIGLVVFFFANQTTTSGVTIDTNDSSSNVQYPLDQGTCGQQFLDSKEDDTVHKANETKPLNNARIINGQDAVPYSWPWLVSLRRIHNNKIGSHFCAGSLVYSQYVITAAHCVHGLSAKQLAIIVGSNNLNDLTNKFYAIDIVQHEQFNNKKITNDLAIVKLNKPVKFSSKVCTICMANSSADASRVITKRAVLAGWGSTTGDESSSSLSTSLKEIKLKVINGENLCAVSSSYDPSKMYCAIDADKSRTTNSCFGDSGGPLAYYTNGAWYIYGIASFLIVYENGKCDPAYPSYYTQVPRYIDWIYNKIQILNSKKG